MKHLPIILVMSFFSMIMTGCAQGKLWLANAPTAFDSVSVEENISFGPEPLHKLDIYKQRNTALDQPTIIFFYGGRWTTGEKSQYAFVASTLAKEGYVVVVPDYRKYPNVKFPAFVEDGTRAVNWVHEHIADYGGDPENIFVTGHSSGAHIGALIAADPKYLGAYSKERSIIKAFAGLAGPYSFEPEEDDLKDMFGPPENYPQMQVTTFIDGAQPPMFLMYGAEDDLVHIRNLEKLEDAIRKKGGIVKTRIYEDMDHIKIVGALSWLLDDLTPIKDDIVNFFEMYQDHE